MARMGIQVASTLLSPSQGTKLLHKLGQFQLLDISSQMSVNGAPSGQYWCRLKAANIIRLAKHVIFNLEKVLPSNHPVFLSYKKRTGGQSMTTIVPISGLYPLCVPSLFWVPSQNFTTESVLLRVVYGSLSYSLRCCSSYRCNIQFLVSQS